MSLIARFVSSAAVAVGSVPPFGVEPVMVEAQMTVKRWAERGARGVMRS